MTLIKDNTELRTEHLDISISEKMRKIIEVSKRHTNVARKVNVKAYPVVLGKIRGD